MRQVSLSGAGRGCQVCGAPQVGLGWRVTWAFRGLLVIQACWGRREGPSTLPTSRHPSFPTNGWHHKCQRSTLPSTSTGQWEQNWYFMLFISCRNKNNYLKLQTNKIANWKRKAVWLDRRGALWTFVTNIIAIYVSSYWDIICTESNKKNGSWKFWW